MRSALRILKVTVIAYLFIILPLLFLLIIPIILLQRFGYDSYLFIARVILTSTACSTMVVIFYRYIEGKERVIILICLGLIIFVLTLPISWVLYSYIYIYPDMGTITNLEILRTNIR